MVSQPYITLNTGHQNNPIFKIPKEKLYNWKGGITPLVLQIRHCFKYKDWVRECFKRDDWKCQLCNNRGGRLEADHFPVKFSTLFYENKINTLDEALNCEDLWNLDNSRTLCKICHKNAHKK